VSLFADVEDIVNYVTAKNRATNTSDVKAASLRTMVAKLKATEEAAPLGTVTATPIAAKESATRGDAINAISTCELDSSGSTIVA